MACHINWSDPGHTRLKQQYKKILQISLTSPSKEEKKKDEKSVTT